MLTYDEYAKMRDEMHLRDSDVARQANIPQSTFSDWKKGKSSPKYEKMQKIGKVLGMPYHETTDSNGKTWLEFDAETELKQRYLDLIRKINSLSSEDQDLVETFINKLIR